MLRIETLDHIVLAVEDVAGAVAWYRDVLGLEVLRLEEWRSGEVAFPSVRVDAGTIIDLVRRPPASAPTANLDHFCLVANADPSSLATDPSFDVVEGPVRRWGARGEATSVYVRDPDGNVVEIRWYGDGAG